MLVLATVAALVALFNSAVIVFGIVIHALARLSEGRASEDLPRIQLKQVRYAYARLNI